VTAYRIRDDLATGRYQTPALLLPSWDERRLDTIIRLSVLDVNGRDK